MKTTPFRMSFVMAGIVAMGVLLTSCGPRPVPETVTWADLMGQLADPARIARLDTLDTSIVTSFDPSGGNDDFNHFVRKGPKGWVVLADLEGPGYVSRFWFTGAESGEHRVRFYFDGEKEPGLELTVGELCGGKEPFVPPLAAYENYCWYSWIPIPYARRLTIMTQEGGYKEGNWPRIFYQINSSRLPPGEGVRNFSLPMDPAGRAAWERARDMWAAGGLASVPDGAATESRTLRVEPGSAALAMELPGPSIVWRLSMTPDLSAISSAVARENALREWAVEIAWDGADQPSVRVPFGDLFGSVWKRTRYRSLYFGASNDTFELAFPMPFAKSARVSLRNDGPTPLAVRVDAAHTPLSAWDARWGYFHAAWSGSSAQDVGRPHRILETEGRGRFVGCLLGVVALDRTWWILEGDEVMTVDGRKTPAWHGTGLEDYFNGGWYYQNVLIRPLHGLPAKSFFRIVQYRLHLVDPVGFEQSFKMIFERGPDNASHGAMESVGYAYTAEPTPAPFLPPRTARQPPRDPLTEPSIMTDLLNYERFGDYTGARDYIDWFLETYPSFPMADILRLRQIAYDERIEGFAAVRERYERFLESGCGEAAAAQARDLLWFHESPKHALVSLYGSMKSSALIDGAVVARTERPDRAVVARAVLEDGEHVVAVMSAKAPYPDWIQACVRTHRGLVGTSPRWRMQYKPDGRWSAVDYDDSGWKEVGGTGAKGPPEEPFVWLEPNAHVDMLSRAIGIRGGEWPDASKPYVFRQSFVTGPGPEEM